MNPSLSSLHVSVLLFCLAFVFNDALSLQSLYSEARRVRALQGHDRALPLYQEILALNPNDATAATRIAADPRSTTNHDAFGDGGDRAQRLGFTKLLESFGFNRDSIADFIFAHDAEKAAKAKRSSAPLFLQPLRAGSRLPPPPTSPLGACIQLLLLSVCLPTNCCIDLLGNDFVELLECLGIAFVSRGENDADGNDGLVVPYTHVFPVTVSGETVFLATDLHPNVLSLTSVGNSKYSTSGNDGNPDDNGSVMYIGPDSL